MLFRILHQDFLRCSQRNRDSLIQVQSQGQGPGIQHAECLSHTFSCPLANL